MELTRKGKDIINGQQFANYKYLCGCEMCTMEDESYYFHTTCMKHSSLVNAYLLNLVTYDPVNKVQ